MPITTNQLEGIIADANFNAKLQAHVSPNPLTWEAPAAQSAVLGILTVLGQAPAEPPIAPPKPVGRFDGPPPQAEHWPWGDPGPEDGVVLIGKVTVVKTARVPACLSPVAEGGIVSADAVAAAVSVIRWGFHPSLVGCTRGARWADVASRYAFFEANQKAFDGWTDPDLGKALLLTGLSVTDDERKRFYPTQGHITPSNPGAYATMSFEEWLTGLSRIAGDPGGGPGPVTPES